MVLFSFSWWDRVQLCVTAHIILRSLKLWLPALTSTALHWFTLKYFGQNIGKGQKHILSPKVLGSVTIKQTDPSNKWIVQHWLAALLLKILLCSATRFGLTALLLVLSGPFPHWPGLVLWQQLQMNYLS